MSNAGEPLDEVVHPGPEGASDMVVAMQYDDAAQTLEILVRRWFSRDDVHALWLTLDVDDLSVLATRELGPGGPRMLELDGEGGAWIAFGGGLHRFDARGIETWSAEIGSYWDIAIDHQTPRAYVLQRDEGETPGILVVEP
jgi:hypothetical protein